MTELDDKIAAVMAVINQLGVDLTKTLADLKAQVAAGQPPTPEQLAALDTVATTLTNMDATVKAADPGPAV